MRCVFRGEWQNGSEGVRSWTYRWLEWPTWEELATGGKGTWCWIQVVMESAGVHERTEGREKPGFSFGHGVDHLGARCCTGTDPVGNSCGGTRLSSGETFGWIWLCHRRAGAHSFPPVVAVSSLADKTHHNCLPRQILDLTGCLLFWSFWAGFSILSVCPIELNTGILLSQNRLSSLELSVQADPLPTNQSKSVYTEQSVSITNLYLFSVIENLSVPLFFM